MVYYDRLGNACEFKDEKRFNYGRQADIFLYNDIVLKTYYETVCRMDYKTFATLRRIKSRNFISLIDSYSKIKGDSQIDAYTYRFIEDKHDLNMYTTEKFINEVEGLIRLVDFFSNFYILMDDVHKDNLIFSDHIKLIDPDKYLIATYMEKDYISFQNRIQLLSALKSYLRENTRGISEERLYNLFKVNKKGNIGEEMQLKLTSKEYMKDYLIK